MHGALDQPELQLRRPSSRGTWAFGCAGALVLVLALGGLSVWLWKLSRNAPR